MIFLNHHFKNKNTPANYLDWLNLFYESTHNPEKYTLNLENKGIKKAVELIDFEKLSPQQRHNMKIDAQRKVVRRLNQEEGFDKGKKEGIEEGKKEGIEEGKKEGIEEGKKEGIEEGKKEGKVESKREIAKKSLEKGIPPDLVADITGLSVEEIETL
ncbi:MAG: hypothetical protein GY710_15765 [Desulfobacteraceae bacterium]|nr:hypothetical protein [Desulfobacteraceae bacterium]